MTVIAFGKSVLPGEPYSELIETCETLLADARSGNLRALAFATVRESKVLGTGWDGADGTRNSLAAAVSMLNHRYVAMALLKQD